MTDGRAEFPEEVRALAARVGGGRWDASRETLELSSPHVHLPKLADAGVIEYDRDDRTVRDATSPALEAFVACVRATEGD